MRMCLKPHKVLAAMHEHSGAVEVQALPVCSSVLFGQAGVHALKARCLTPVCTGTLNTYIGPTLTLMGLGPNEIGVSRKACACACVGAFALRGTAESRQTLRLGFAALSHGLDHGREFRHQGFRMPDAGCVPSPAYPAWNDKRPLCQIFGK